MESEKVKWGDKMLYVHHISPRGDYILVSESPEKTKLFKLAVADLDEEGKKLCADLLEQVEKQMNS
jgi:hypothetical protein